ncbi:unnamed protein product [Adineta ricciae]|uniref:Uncharacterized protein n=1 Tax=Adineta ricciae TaxID=249248 RepID=A0A815FBJ5_ADIRI|nr:unnamed protein product [Adineta ricciae]
MFFDILAMFIVTLLSSLFLSTTSISALPSSASSLQLITNSPSADFTSSLRLLKHRPVTSVDRSEVFVDESNEDDDSSDEQLLNISPRKFFALESQHQEKRSPPSPRVHVNSAVATLAESSSIDNAVDYDQFQEPIRLSSSLRKLVETNPLARAWLTMLLQKLMQEQPVPYIFKYGRRRK